MKNITYPTSLFDRPFSDTGNKQIIPENQSGSGRASLVNGFPAETQLPLNQGGIAPNRLDFNGAFYMLSAMAFWQQSGGMWQWSTALNYTTPCLVFHQAKLWWCVQDNGPQAPNAAAVEPGTNESYWIEFLQALANMSGGGSLGADVGDIKYHCGTTAPNGWFIMNGSSFNASQYPLLYAKLGSNIVPDWRGLFIRGYDPTGRNDPDGTSRSIMSIQGDAIRSFPDSSFTARNFDNYDDPNKNHFGLLGASGAFKLSEATVSGASGFPEAGVVNRGARVTLDISAVVPTAAENRPKNASALICIKHD